MKTAYFVTGLLVFAFVGCTPDPKSGKGFSLPEGDIERGQQTFTQLKCQACHTVAGVTFEEAEMSQGQNVVPLGGVKSRVETYGELVTSIINPSHSFAEGYEDTAKENQSAMRTYNSEMTIQQLIDLVTFLESHYSVKSYDRTPYSPYAF
jgi:mono/diheme cytochrome c family protein